MKKNCKRFLSTLLSLSILFASTAAALEVKQPLENTAEVNTIKDVLDVPTEQANRIVNVFDKKVEEVAALSYETDRMAISQIKELRDFSENQYLLVECNPSGYLIYHVDSGRFVEYAPDSPSPYKDISSDETLYYGGPMEYYFLENSQFVHTILEEKYDISNQKDFSIHSETVSNYFSDNADEDTLSYIENKSQPLEKAQKDASQGFTTNSEILFPNYINVGDIFYIQNAAQIDRLYNEQQMSYIHAPGGACGYVAAAILILWHKTTILNNYLTVNNSTGRSYTSITNEFTHFNGNPKAYTDGLSFSYNLYRWHSGKGTTGDYSTTGWNVKDTIESYLNARNIPVNSVLYTLPGNYEIVTFLHSYNRPFILGGTLTAKYSNKSKGWHFCTVYGYYRKTQNEALLIAHFGWENYNRNFVDGIWTQGYGIKSEK